jgi:two-component system sensor histidine kinase/response regulator
MDSSAAPRTILVVDNEPPVAALLREILRRAGHEVETCESGAEALAAAVASSPDVILLDIDMPEMDGLEVCARLKAIPATADIPVLFVTGRSGLADTVAGFQAGAVDYICKPFQAAEVVARVGTHVRLRDLQRALADRNAQLEAAVAVRTRELADANQRLRMLDQTKDDFLRIIAHELRTPLNGVLGIGELVFDELGSSSGLDELRQAYTESRQRIESLLDEALTLVDINLGGRTLPIRDVPFDLVVDRALQLVQALAQSRRVVARAEGSSLTLPGDEEWLVKAIHAMLTAAVRLSAGGAVIVVRVVDEGRGRVVIIESTGASIPEQVLAQLFEAFSIKEADTGGGTVGLGPPMAQRILGLFGAVAGAENTTPGGFRLTARWPSPASLTQSGNSNQN